MAVWRYDPAQAWAIALTSTNVKNELAEEGMEVEKVRHRVRRASEAVATRVLLDGDDYEIHCFREHLKRSTRTHLLRSGSSMCEECEVREREGDGLIGAECAAQV